MRLIRNGLGKGGKNQNVPVGNRNWPLGSRGRSRGAAAQSGYPEGGGTSWKLGGTRGPLLPRGLTELGRMLQPGEGSALTSPSCFGQRDSGSWTWAEAPLSTLRGGVGACG